jgi:hypothetical protein
MFNKFSRFTTVAEKELLAGKMKLKLFFSLFILIQGTSAGYKTFEMPKINELLKRATVDVILNFYAKNAKFLNIFQDSLRNDSGFISEVLIATSSQIPLEVEDYRFFRHHPKKVSNSVFFVENFFSFSKILLNLTPKNFNFGGNHFIVLTKYYSKIKEDIKQIFEELLETNIINVNILAQTGDIEEVEMLTFDPYQSGNCGTADSYILNIFRNNSFIEKDVYFPDKLSDLHKCPIKVVIFDSAPFMILNNQSEPGGIDGTILNFLADALNFTAQIIVADKKGFLFENGSADGAIKMLMDEKAELSIGYFSTSLVMNQYLAGSYFYWTSRQKWIVPPGKPFSPFEKLFKPFQYNVWTAISITFIIIFTVILVLKFFPKYARTFLYGKGQSAGVNVMSIAFLGSIHRTPKRNFARFTLMIFMIYSLIIRTAYEGSLYKFLSKSYRHPIKSTLDSMLESNFTFYVLESSRNFIVFFPKVMER